KVPTDLAVVGFAGIESGALTTPPLTSVSQRFDHVGSIAGWLALRSLSEEIAVERFVSPARLVIRESCGCPPHGPQLPSSMPGAEPAENAPSIERAGAQLHADLQSILATHGDTPERRALITSLADRLTRAVEAVVARPSTHIEAELRDLASALYTNA